MKDILPYIKKEKKALIIVTITGLIYNIGLIANPYFEGRLVGIVASILDHKASYNDVLKIVTAYCLIISFVQVNRYYKREYVRIFANNINKSMKEKIFHNLINTNALKLKNEGTGNILTKAIKDVDDCSEGIRKFTTEIFDTGIAFLAYYVMMLIIDIKITLLCFIFIIFSFYLAQKMKVIILKNSTEAKIASAKLSDATLDNGTNHLTYIVSGNIDRQLSHYKSYLNNYETCSVKASLPANVLPPIYKSISYLGIIFIMYLGINNIQNNIWTIATLTTYISSFMKMAEKVGKSAALFNSVHKAEVSYERIKEYLNDDNKIKVLTTIYVDNLKIENLGFHYPGKEYLFKDISINIKKGEIIGLTGEVACGKSTFGKLFLNEYNYDGKILINNSDLKSLKDQSFVTYLGHDSELFNDTISENICLGEDVDVDYYLKLVCLDKEVDKDTIINASGSSLSGGQEKRVAIARSLAHCKSILILDDPFSALDKKVEQEIFNNLLKYYNDKIIILITHRLTMFDKCKQIIFMGKDRVYIDTHCNLLENNSEYKKLYNLQKDDSHEK